jgi:phospholipid/cholesterol/gamma-HCH transport system substrate-binding protein
MTRESYALYTGLFLLALIAAAVAITLWLGRYGDASETYVVTTNGSVSGLVEESTVLYRGVNAGKVVSIRFDPEDVRNILVKINVQKGLPITHGTYAKLRIQGLTGLAQIELGDSGEQPEPLETTPANPARITMRPSLVDKLSDSGGNILIRAEELIARLNAILNSDGQQRIQHILENLETSTGKLASLEDRLDTAFAQVPPLTGNAQQSLHHLEEMMRQIGQLLKEGHTLLNRVLNFSVRGR